MVNTDVRKLVPQFVTRSFSAATVGFVVRFVHVHSMAHILKPYLHVNPTHSSLIFTPHTPRLSPPRLDYPQLQSSGHKLLWSLPETEWIASLQALPGVSLPCKV